MWGQGHGQQRDSAPGKTPGDPGELIIVQSTSSVDGLQLTLPLTGAVDISSCLLGALYNLSKAQEGTAPHPFPLSNSDGCPSSSTDFFGSELKKRKAQPSAVTQIA